MPIRLRLTAAFALAMAVVLAATGFFLYDRLGATLDRTLDDGLRARAADVAALVRQADSGLSTAGGPGVGFAQVLDARGRIFDETAGLGRRPLLDPARLARARHRSILVGGRLGDTSVRLLALPVRAQDERLVVVVGTSLEERRNALAGLRRELLIGGPVALVVASLVGYALAAAALRPVERMRRRAAAISASELDRRLPMPGRRDEIGRLGSTLNEMLDRLEHALERERAFVSDASHELRTPLALLKTEIELALEEPRSSGELRAALLSAGEETDRLSQLADDLLLLARVDDGSLPIRRARVELGDVLASVAARFARRSAAAGRSLEVVGGEGRTASVDALRIEQALGNLVENALRHGSGTVRLAVQRIDGRIELHVTDDGDGFPAGFLERAFERFSRADDARGRSGTGLGLAIVSAIARAHGGSALAANLPAGGADVWLALPAVEHVEPDAGPGLVASTI